MNNIICGIKKIDKHEYLEDVRGLTRKVDLTWTNDRVYAKEFSYDYAVKVQKKLNRSNTEIIVLKERSG